MVMRGLLWYQRLIAYKATQGAAAQFILQRQHTENPHNIYDSLTWEHESSLLQLWSAFVMTPSQMFWARVVRVLWL